MKKEIVVDIPFIIKCNIICYIRSAYNEGAIISKYRQYNQDYFYLFNPNVDQKLGLKVEGNK